MRHSQEEIAISSEKLDVIGVELAKVEKELRHGMGLRETRRKSSEWKVANTIDLITVILESWGRGTVESVMTQPRIDGKKVRKYSLEINKGNTLWNKIYNSNVNLYENVLRL
jgi:hypothetical protein